MRHVQGCPRFKKPDGTTCHVVNSNRGDPWVWRVRPWVTVRRDGGKPFYDESTLDARFLHQWTPLNEAAREFLCLV